MAPAAIAAQFWTNRAVIPTDRPGASHPHHVLGKADFGGVGVAGKHVAQHRMVGRDLLAFGEQRQREVAPPPGDDGVPAACGLADIERCEQPVRRDGGGQSSMPSLPPAPRTLAFAGTS